MNFSFPFVLLLWSVLTTSLSAAQTQQDLPAPKRENIDHPATPLKAIRTEMAPYPEEARKKRIQGTVKLRIVVDARGNVSEVRVLRGPKELVPAAIASVKSWQYEPPLPAPVVDIVEVSYGFPRTCPGSESDSGGVISGARLVNNRGKVFAVPENDEYTLPPYPDEERKAGAVGKMVLGVTLDPDGQVKGVRALKSLSPGLDKAAIDTVGRWKFKPIDPKANMPLEELRLYIFFEATCPPKF